MNIRRSARLVMSFLAAAVFAAAVPAAVAAPADQAPPPDRLQWFREAKFGLFIHWGVYSMIGREEWARQLLQIPLEEYQYYADNFNPTAFDPDAWAALAKDAGVRYVVITSKHHDGFAIFDSAHTTYDIMASKYGKDILGPLSVSMKKAGIPLGFYYSIMDWHHPDYLPRRDWEKSRTAQGANFDRYVAHMKNQLEELLTKYGDIGVLWFDGEWERTWNQNYGRDLYSYVRAKQPAILVNNRVGAGRAGMQGLTREGEFGGDFGTPEQEIPPTGLPGVYWETCMTMNNNWGYNKNDSNWKSTRTLVRMLADIASKGGNFLLNVGPTAEGLFPQPSIDRLREIGRWMDVNGESIYATNASPFQKLDWGRCTSKPVDGGTRLYLHVFEWPSAGSLIVPGLFNAPRGAYLLSDSARRPLEVTRKEDSLVIRVPPQAPDSIDSVVVLDVAGAVVK